ncbi:MAG: signal peptidase I [Clostridia bacterium]|nr:signal peptidase I [Clostridia bacterium]
MSKPAKSTKSNKFLTVLGVILCIILIPILIVNCTLIVKSLLNEDEVPRIGKWLPLVVLTDSMYPEIESGDMIICQITDAEDIQVKDVIAFFDPAGNGTSVVTHRVEEITEKDGMIYFSTKGDANNTADEMPVPANKLVGKYHSRIAGVGHVVMFMQTTQGLLLCVVLPIIILIAYDMIRRKKFDKEKAEDTEELLKELEALRAMKQQAEENNTNGKDAE